MRRIEVLTVACPPGTPQAAAVETDIAMAPGRVDRIEVTIPGGHAFLTGIAIAQAHQPVIPWTPGEFLIGDNDRLAYEIDDPTSSGGWSVFVYNTDPVYSHTWQVRWIVRDLATLPRQRSYTPVPTDQIVALAAARGPIGGE